MKKIKSKVETHNILYYVSVYFIIVLLIIGVMGGYFYYFLYETVYSDFRIGNKQHLAEIVNRHENDMQIIDDIVMQMELDEEEALTKFRLEDEPKKSDPLTKRLKGYTTVSQFFDIMFYHYHKDDYLYNHLSSVNLKFFLESGCFFGKTDALQVLKNLLYDVGVTNVVDVIPYFRTSNNASLKSGPFVVSLGNESKLIIFYDGKEINMMLNSQVQYWNLLNACYNQRNTSIPTSIMNYVSKVLFFNDVSIQEANAYYDAMQLALQNGDTSLININNLVIDYLQNQLDNDEC